MRPIIACTIRPSILLKEQLLRVCNIEHLHGGEVIHPVISAKAGIQGFSNSLQAEDWTPAFAGATPVCTPVDVLIRR